MSEQSESPVRWWPGLTSSNDPAIRKLLDEAQMVELPANSPVFHTGSSCDNFLLLVEGSVRVFLTSASGREVTLYRISGGDSCILTTSCLIGNEPYPAQAVTEAPVRALAIGRGRFDRTMDESPEFRRFVFDGFSHRLADMIQRIDTVTFAPIDQQLADALLRDHESGNPTTATHQDLAFELGTAREVVSRHLKRFETNGLIELGRGRVTVLDPRRLAEIRDSGSA